MSLLHTQTRLGTSPSHYRVRLSVISSPRPSIRNFHVVLSPGYHVCPSAIFMYYIAANNCIASVRVIFSYSFVLSFINHVLLFIDSYLQFYVNYSLVFSLCLPIIFCSIILHQLFYFFYFFLLIFFLINSFVISTKHIK